MSTTYEEFVSSKMKAVEPVGFEPSGFLMPLFDFQADIVRWSVRRGRAAIYADTGLGKTLMQLEWARQVLLETGRPVLIVAPLCVANQTVKEAARYGLDVTYSREPGLNEPGIYITNYEMLEKFNPSVFGGLVLDESSIIKHREGKFRKYITSEFRCVPFRLSCTATPSPNDYMELGTQAEFIGVMTLEEMLATYFTHDGGNTSKWRLKGHGKVEFWKWLASWAIVIKHPRDLGYDDARFDLPPIDVQEHVIQTNAMLSGELFAREAQTLSERREAKRATIEQRAARVAELCDNGEQWIIWCNLNAESDALVRAIPGSVDIKGSDSIETKERRLLEFTSGEQRVLISKASITGYGLNWQHCNHMAFVGLSDSYEQYYQAVRRCYRFGQTKTVHVHIITSDLEGAIKRNIERKERQAQEMSESMVKEVCAHSDIKEGVGPTDTEPYSESGTNGEGWSMVNGDCVKVLSRRDADSVDYTIFSPPFASLYTYSNSEYDMGNVKTRESFWDQFEYLVPELYRVTKPGRLLSFHCMQLPKTKSFDGVIGLIDFRGQMIRAFERHGWIFHSEVCIWKDPVTAMQRTKAIGLLWKQIKKDSSLSRQGIPDYLVTMRKPGDNPEPIEHSAEEFPVEQWQKWASPVWTDINMSETLNRDGARETDDERHICPLQLEVIRRGVRLWSNPGDVVMSPFAGIGSELYVALQEGRKAYGVELKRSYFEKALDNLRSVNTKQLSIFDLEAQ